MEEYISFQKIINLFSQFAKQNVRLNSFGFGNFVDFGQTLSDTGATYSFMFVVPQGVSYAQTTTTYSMAVLFGDKLSDDLKNQSQIVSDMSLLARQFLSQIYQSQGTMWDFLDLSIPTQGEPFLERFNDVVAGWALNLNVTVFEDMNVCNPYAQVTPDEISGLFAWYDLQDQSTITIINVDQIAQLNDKSGNNYDLTPFSTRPEYTKVPSGNLSNYYSMKDTSGTALVHNLSPTQFTEYTLFVVSDIGSDGLRNTFSVSSGTTYSIVTWSTKSYGLSVLTIGRRLTGEDSIASLTASPFVDRNSAILAGRMSGSTDLKLMAYLDSFTDVSSAGSISVTNTDTFDYIVLGQPGSASGDLHICEAILYDRKLNDQEYNDVVDYLKLKYNFRDWN